MSKASNATPGRSDSGPREKVKTRNAGGGWFQQIACRGPVGEVACGAGFLAAGVAFGDGGIIRVDGPE